MDRPNLSNKMPRHDTGQGEGGRGRGGGGGQGGGGQGGVGRAIKMPTAPLLPQTGHCTL